jgi:ribonuclease P protein component
LGDSGKFSFSRARRLDGPHAYAAVFAHQCGVSGQWFKVFAGPCAAGKARLGVVVSKRIMKKAVTRNAYKRLTREVFRHACSTVSGVDFVVRPRAPIEPAEEAAARNELRDLFRRCLAQCRSRLSAGAH